ncbi:MAG TPA: GH3 auxin-responsive promoter family protein, partial [Bacteroidia bacterium]|nr:GH3 auxin-responsive promoter family protein [Bacteroidia bacterium]
MAIIGSVIKRSFELRERLPQIRKKDGYKQQTKVLKKLLAKAEFTAFGEHYNFSKILGEDDVITAFQKTVKTHDYNSMFKNWWHRTRDGEPNVCWPNKIKYFALSSGTSESSSKYIPVTTDMLKVIRKVSLRQMISQVHFGLPKEHFERGVLVVGGSTDLKYNGIYYEGD